MIDHEEYLGDSVYVNWDGFMIELTTENGNSPTNYIALEPEVVASFENFLAKVKDFVKNHPYPAE